jgi:hypothetical protein
MAGVYSVVGQAAEIGDILGGAFDPQSIDANGMLMTYATANRPDAAGALFSVLATTLVNTGLTLVIEYEGAPTSGFPDGPVFAFLDTDNAETAEDYIIADIGSWGFGVWDNRDLSDGGSGEDVDFSGVQRLAVTLNRPIGGGDYEYGGAVNGGPHFIDIVDYGGAYFTVDTIRLFHVDEWEWVFDGLWPNDNGVYVRRLTAYPAVPVEILPELSEPDETS